MIIKPRIRGFICINSHPAGCAAHVNQQVDYVKSQPSMEGPKNVLVIGASTGYGLASRITAAFGYGAKTLGVFFEKPGEEKRTASAGWYNSAAFHRAADEAGVEAYSINGDAFSDEIKQEAVAKLKEMGQVDLVIYSLASPRRIHPKTAEDFRSVLKPIGQSVTAKTLNTDKQIITEVSIEEATQNEIDSTVAVMGGEDWEMWIDVLQNENLLAPGCNTMAYTYIGDKLTWPIYGKATIGKAKEDLDRAAMSISEKLGGDNRARVAVLKAIVTQSSSAIPIMPLYISLLYKVMKEEGTHEGCIEQIYGLFQQLATNELQLDDQGRLRRDQEELKDETQRKVEALWPQVVTENIDELTDYAGYRADFLKLFGFGIEGIDYEKDIDPIVPLGI